MTTDRDKLTTLSGILRSWRHRENADDADVDAAALRAIRDVLNPAPLTRERARAFLDRERDRIANHPTPSESDWSRRHLLILARNADRNPGAGDSHETALADLLVDAAAGRVK